MYGRRSGCNEKPEVIINERENFANKLKYYKLAYNDDLVLKTYDGIRITNIVYGNTYGELEDLITVF